jgi:TonB family protein
VRTPGLKLEDMGPQRARSGTIIEEEYPPLLRSAGVGGTVGLRLHVTDGGKADDIQLSRSSGHDALDQAAMRVAKRFEWGHEGSDKKTDYWTHTSITFGKEQSIEVEVRPSMREELRSLPRKIDDGGEPHFTPFTEKPELRNRDVVGKALVRSYPPLLRDAGIGGTVMTWLLIDENGKVVNAKVKESSGLRELDNAALQVARVMEFRAAENNGIPVNVWIALPVVFKAQ